MAIDIYFTNRSLTQCSHALCAAQRRDTRAIREWVERPDGGRREEHVARLYAGMPAPAMAVFAEPWPAMPSHAVYALRLGGAEYDVEGQLLAENATPLFLGFLSHEEFDDAVRAADDADVTSAWSELQNMPAPAGTRYVSQADAICHDCLLKDLAWNNCNPRLCNASGLPYLAAGLAMAIDRGVQADQIPGARTHYRETLEELLRCYEIQPNGPTPHLDRTRTQRVHAEPVESDDVEVWPDEHPIAHGLLEALLFREAPITADEASFLIARLQMLTHLLSQIVEEQEGQMKRIAYRALTLMGTYIRCLRITQRFELEMVLVTR